MPQAVWEQPLLALRAELPYLPTNPFDVPAQRYLDLLNESAGVIELKNAQAKAIRFVDARELAGLEYEPGIFDSGQVPTRIDGFSSADVWHDYFNALMWLLWPLTKAAINKQQVLAQARIAQRSANQRSAEQDRLTLLDESGLLVVCTPAMGACFAQRDWQALFIEHASAHAAGQFKVFVFGHGLMQKLAHPFKSITGQACVVIADEPELLVPDAAFNAQIVTLKKPQALPVMGLPNWHRTWFAGEQDQQFYNDLRVFRR